MVRKVIAILAFVGALAGSAYVTSAASFSAGGVCAPGQHGNPHPAFKPGSCK